MLILTRRAGETLMIGDDIQITVLGINKHQVRVGVTAPKEVAVHREEVYRRIQKEEQEATSTQEPTVPVEVVLAREDISASELTA